MKHIFWKGKRFISNAIFLYFHQCFLSHGKNRSDAEYNKALRRRKVNTRASAIEQWAASRPGSEVGLPSNKDPRCGPYLSQLQAESVRSTAVRKRMKYALL